MTGPGPAIPYRVLRCTACHNTRTLIPDPDHPNRLDAGAWAWCEEDGWRCPCCKSTKRTYTMVFEGSAEESPPST